MHEFRIPAAGPAANSKRTFQFEDRVRAAFGPGRMLPSGVDWGHIESEWRQDHWIFRAKTPFGNRWLMLNDPDPSRGQALLSLHPLDF